MKMHKNVMNYFFFLIKPLSNLKFCVSELRPDPGTENSVGGCRGQFLPSPHPSFLSHSSSQGSWVGTTGEGVIKTLKVWFVFHHCIFIFAFLIYFLTWLRWNGNKVPGILFNYFYIFHMFFEIKFTSPWSIFSIFLRKIKRCA